MFRNLLIVSLVLVGTAAIYPAFGVDSVLAEHRQALKDCYDTNNDGVISAAELQAFREDRLEKIQDLRAAAATSASTTPAPVIVSSGIGSGCASNPVSVGCNRNTLDRLENVRDRRENVWDRRHHGGALDRLEDVHDRRENRWDRRH